MATVTGFTAERSQAIEDKAIVNGEVVGDNLILTTKDGTTIDAGSVRGPQGEEGDPGTPGDLSQTTADARYSKKVNLVDNLVYPFVIPHRGGHLIWPEHSLEAFNWCAENGWPIEPDCHVLSDNKTIAVVHDATTTRTMQQIEGTANSTVSTISKRNWMRNYKILPELAGSDYGRTTHLEELLDLYGGKVLIVPEIKVTGARVPVCDAIVNRGLQKACIVQSFDLADCTYAVSRGIEAMHLGTTQTAAQLLAAGIKFAGLSESATDAQVDALVAGGIKVARYTINSKATTESMINANRAHMIFSDDPDWAFGRRAISYSDPFAKRIPWPHLLTPDSDTTATYLRSNLMFKGGGFGNKMGAQNNGGALQDWCPPIVSGKANIYFEVEFGDQSASQTRFTSIWFGKLPGESPHIDSQAIVGQAGFHCLMRRDGTLDLYQIADNALPGTAVASFSGAVLAPAGQSTGPWRFKFTRDAAGVTLKNLNNGQSVTFAVTGSIFANSKFQFNWNGTDGIVRNVRVEEIP